MKAIAVNPDWIKTELPYFSNDNGNSMRTIETHTAVDVRWITMVAKSTDEEIMDHSVGDDDPVLYGCKFRIEGIDYDCQELLLQWKEIDENASSSKI